MPKAKGFKKELMKKILAILLLLTCSILAAEKDKLNVIVIMADALGYYGGEIKTPNLDAIAADYWRSTRRRS